MDRFAILPDNRGTLGMAVMMQDTAAPWKDANISATGTNVAEKHVRRVKRFKLLGYAQKLLIRYDIQNKSGTGRHRTRNCHAALAHTATHATIQLNNNAVASEANYAGLQTCGSIWSCPVCASRIAVSHGREIQRALQWAEIHGFIPVMVTLTARHNQYMKLVDFKTQFKAAWQLFTNTRNWRFLKKHYCIEHWIANREVTHGQSGWHYHQHMLLFIERKKLAQGIVIENLEQDLSEAWLKALSAHALDGIEGIALKLTAHGNVGEKYLTKLGLTEASDTHELHYELSGSENKTQAGRNIWDILRHAYYGDELAELLYIEYVQAMAGDNWITWSHGFHDTVDSEPVNEQAASEQETGDFHDWLHLPTAVWYRVKVAGAYGELLKVAAASRDREHVKRYLLGLRDELFAAGQFCPPLHTEICPVCGVDWLQCDCHGGQNGS